MRSLLALLVAATASIPTAAAAQSEPPFPTEEFSAVYFTPSSSEQDYLELDGAALGGLTTPTLGLFLDYAAEPLEIFTQCDERPELDCDVLGEKRVLATSQVAITLDATYTFGDRVRVGLALPLVASSGDGLPFRFMGDPNNDITGGSGFGIADPRLSVKARLFGGREAGFAVAAAAWVRFPLGQATSEGRWIGDDGLGAGGHAIAELYAGRSLRLALNLGGYYRPVRAVVATDVGPGMSYAAAGDFTFTPEHSGVQVGALAELEGATSFGERIDQLEGRLAARVDIGDLSLLAGFGVGFVLGPGVPDGRLILGARFAGHPDSDEDGDGLIDDDDACPDLPEDIDDFHDEDGCPEEDNDDDGLADEEDGCPNEPEDMDGHDDEDGCPEEDNDGDGVRDGYDSCPEIPEDLDGDRDDDGCPDEDSDGDNIEDRHDRCPNEPEDTDGFGDDDGCPEEDFDQDGIPDEDDHCPEDAEDIDNHRDRDGCPEETGSINASPRNRTDDEE